MNQNLQIAQKFTKNHFAKPSRQIVYNLKDYGLDEKFTGKGVKIAILDTGKPDHTDIKNVIESVDVFDETKSPKDLHGHSTMISGFIAGNGPNIKRLAYESSLYYAKISNNNGDTNYNAIVAGVLWAVVKKVDIILMSFSTNYDFSLFHTAIKKAHDSNICILAASDTKNSDKSYPADYAEVFSCKSIISDDNLKLSKQSDLPYNLNMNFPADGLETTFLQDTYIKASGSSFAAALGSGLAASIICKRKNKGLNYNTRGIFSELSDLNLN